MQSSPQSASTPQAGTLHEPSRGRPVDDVVYQLVTVCAILLVLCSVWLF